MLPDQHHVPTLEPSVAVALFHRKANRRMGNVQERAMQVFPRIGDPKNRRFQFGFPFNALCHGKATNGVLIP